MVVELVYICFLKVSQFGEAREATRFAHHQNVFEFVSALMSRTRELPYCVSTSHKIHFHTKVIY